MKNKYLKYTIIVFFTGFISCETIELDLTQSPNQVTVDNLDPDFLFNNIQLGFGTFVENVAGYGSFTASVSRQFAMTSGNTYENAYTPISFNGIWSSAYAGILADIQAIEPIADELNLKYHLGVSKLMKAYVYITLVDLFGDVPYTEALQGNANLNPNADNQITIYNAMLDEIDDAISLLSQESALYPPEDFYFSDGGTVDETTQTRWITTANTLKLRVFNNVRLAGSDLGIDITTAINDLINAGDLIDESSEDWVIQYGINRLNPNTRHPGYNGYYETAAGGYMSNYFMWQLSDEKGFDDPRLTYYFYRQDTNANNEDVFTLGCVGATPPAHYANYTSIYGTGETVPFCVADASRGYWGRDQGDNGGIPPDGQKRTVYGLYPAGGLYDDGSSDSAQEEGTLGEQGAGITPILLSSFVEFIRAESALMSGTIGDPRLHLENGIRASMNKVIGFLGVAGDATQTDVDNYVNFVLGEYDSAADQNSRLEIIMKEYHIACFGNGLEAYNNYRRTGMPSNMQPTLIEDSGDFYNSVIYPANYVDINSNAIQKSRTERIFWDQNAIDLHLIIKTYIKFMVMKNIYKIIFALVLLISFTSCEDENKNPLLDEVPAAYVFIDIENPVLDVTDLQSSTYGGVITAPANNVASFDVSVRRVSDGIGTDYFPVYSTTSFPADFRVSATDIANALGLNLIDLLAGDRFDFVGTSMGVDGSIVSINNLATDIASEPGQKQAYTLTTYISCPFVQEDMVGTYTIIEDDGFSATGNTTFEIIAGESANEIVLLNPYDSAGNFNITVNVNDFGIASFERQDGVLTEEICCAGYSPTNFRSNASTSLALSCTGYLVLRFSTALSLAGGTGTGFTFGDGVLIAQKNQ